jgi:hypothetical protein
LKDFHKIYDPQKRKELLATAKAAGAQAPKQRKVTVDIRSFAEQPSKFLVTPKKPSRGSRDFRFFNIDKEPILVEFRYVAICIVYITRCGSENAAGNSMNA